MNFKARAALWTFASGIVFRLTSVVVAFLTVPILLNYFGAEVFGAFNTLIVLFFYLNQSGLGVSFSLQTQYPLLKKNENTLRINYTTALILNIFIGLLLFAGSIAFSYSHFFVSKFSEVASNSNFKIDLKISCHSFYLKQS